MVEVDRRDTLGLGFHGGYEPDVEHAIDKLLPPGGIFVDVGANLGWFSLIASRKAGLVVALEPELDNFSRLAGNVVRNGCTNVIPLRLAAGSEATELMLELDETNVGGHRIGGGGQLIRTVRLDQLLDALGCAPDLVKIDVEGFEPEVVEGLGDIRCGLIVEFSPAALRERGHVAKAFFNRLLSHGTVFHTFDGRGGVQLQPITTAPSPPEGGYAQLVVIRQAA